MTTTANANGETETASAPGPAVLRRWSAWLVGWPLTAAVSVLVLGLLAQWVPHYLQWPNSPDLDVFITQAQGWDSGLMLPYRDSPSYQFPGPIYLFWVAGRLAGWGNPMGVHALDAALLVLLGAAMALWTRSRFGRVLPGLIGFVSILGVYLNLNCELVAQREWHTGLFGALALLLPAALPGRWGRVGSALAMGVAFVIRPQAVLFLPAVPLALDEGARGPGESLEKTVVAVLEWGVYFAATVALLFVPLFVSGLWRDFLDGFRQVLPGGPYTRMAGEKPLSIVNRAMMHFRLYRTWSLPLLLLVLVLAGGLSVRLRRATSTWVVAVFSVALYLYLTPLVVTYTDQAVLLVFGFIVALFAQALLEYPGVLSEVRLSAVLLLVLFGVPQSPAFCLVSPSIAALRGTLDRPPGYVGLNPGFVPWPDLAATYDHIRRQSTPETRVANLLFGYPPINSTTGRLSAYPWSGLSLYRIFKVREVWDRVKSDLEASPEGTLVVWSPGEYADDPAAAPTWALVRGTFRPEAKFGAVEIWRKTADPDKAAG